MPPTPKPDSHTSTLPPVDLPVRREPSAYALMDEQRRRGTMVVTLANMRATRLSKDISAHSLSTVTGIAATRIASLEARTKSRLVEPWLDEACTISRALCTNGVLPLMQSGNLTLSELPVGVDLGEDLTALHAGLRLPLSTACRLTLRLGLSDPSQLLIDPLHRQIWDVIEKNERHPEAAGWCPWCGVDMFTGGEGGEAPEHLPTCLPSNLWLRERVPASAIQHPPRPRAAGERYGGSAKAHGLKPLRERLGFTQKEMADAVGLGVNHVARMERLELGLTMDNARRVAARFGVAIDDLYAPDTSQENTNAE